MLLRVRARATDRATHKYRADWLEIESDSADAFRSKWLHALRPLPMIGEMGVAKPAKKGAHVWHVSYM